MALGRQHVQEIDWDQCCALLRIVPIAACAHVMVTSHCTIIVTGMTVLDNIDK